MTIFLGSKTRRNRSRPLFLLGLLTLGCITYFYNLQPTTLPSELLTSPLYHQPLKRSTSAKFQSVIGLSELLKLDYGKDGLVRGWEAAHDLLEKGGLPKREKKRLKEIRDRHPIEELMDQAKKKWEGQLARQSKTLPQAVLEYTKRYNRPPPKGFEMWWQFCKKNGVKIVDDYDQIYRDTAPFWALSPKVLRKRVRELETTPHTYQISLSPDEPSSITGERSSSARGKWLHVLLSPLSSLLPGPITIHCSDHDTGSWVLGDDQKQAALSAAARGMYLLESSLTRYEKKEGRGPAKGLMSACPRDSRGFNDSLLRQKGEGRDIAAKETSFIHSIYPTYDFCQHPELLDHHGALSFDFTRDTKLRPIFQLSKWYRNPEFLTTPLEAYENHTDTKSSNKYSPWEEKDINKLFWRGSSTGDSYSKRKNSNYDWRESHRPKLHLWANDKEGDVDLWVKRGREWEKEGWSKGKVNDFYMDVGLSGKPHQCKKEDGTCAEMEAEINFKERVRPEDAVRYKYVLDVDGNGWSSRFHRLLMSGSLVIKATIYPEWFSDWLTPWYHYIPAQVDYSDMYPILSYFIGSPDGRGGNDELAKQIALNGREFGMKHWRWEDMQAYMFRLLLEYARLMADDREAWSYQKTYK